MNAIRTDDSAFANLPGYGFPPQYVSDLPGYEGLRLHYLDEGPSNASVAFLCLHGQPTWSYLYRKMIPVFTAAGHRVIAPDWFGFGRSDKPTDEAVYTFAWHRDALIALIERLDLHNVVLVCQDWGGLLGLTIPVQMPERFTRLLVMNTALVTGHVKPNAAFFAWRTYSRLNPNMNIARLMRASCTGISPNEAEAYNAPFSGLEAKAGVRRFPNLVPTGPKDPGALIAQRAAPWWRYDWHGETVMAVGVKDPILGLPAMRELHKTIRGCPAPLEFAQAGHFIQEDAGAEVATKALELFQLR